MARAVETDPLMNFRFGVRLDESSPWIGFSVVEIVPHKIGASSGTVRFEKCLGSEFIEFLESVTDRINIGIFHRTEEIGCAEPESQIDLYGVRVNNLVLGSIKFDASGGSVERQVLSTDVTMDYERMVIRAKGGASLSVECVKRRTSRSDHPIIM